MRLGRAGQTYLTINATLAPRHQTQRRQDLRLDDQRNVEVVHCVINCERAAGDSPDEHEIGVEIVDGVAAVVEDDLGEELEGCLV